MSHPRDLTPTSAAPLFSALGDRTRLELLLDLCNGQPRSISELTQGTGLSRQGISKHLDVLKEARLVTSERIGRESKYTVRLDTLSDAKRYLDRASQQWDESIERLRRLVED
ncbi:MAG: metalloregulator ArsR/SmtB family transcription factor [Hyphomicrobiaceae bacterium]|nr:metalloregulator ArsR/SmtB family transcription factor [Hyphomicrobiaceae bacterium]